MKVRFCRICGQRSVDYTEHDAPTSAASRTWAICHGCELLFGDKWMLHIPPSTAMDSERKKRDRINAHYHHVKLREWEIDEMMRLDEKERHNLVCIKSMNRLTERQRLIVRERELEGRTFREIGQRFGVSLERVRQIHAKAIRRLRILADISNANIERGTPCSTIS